MGDDDSPLLNTGDEIETVVVAIDASAEAGRVISTASRFARSAPAAVVHLVHVFRASRLDRARAGAPLQDPHAVEEAKEHLEAQARTMRRQCRNQVVTHLPVGDPSTEVLRLSEELHADFLVVGTHDHTGFDRLILGSHAETLMRKAPCSVMVVRRPLKPRK